MSKVAGLMEAVDAYIVEQRLTAGDTLPSINEMSRKYGVSRDTVFKAYSGLKQKGMVDSAPAKGYFVKGSVKRVLLLLDTYSPFKENLYRNFVESLTEGEYKVDVLFHQYNGRLFKTIVEDSIGRYSYYLIMNFSDGCFSEELRAILPDRLLLLDFGNFEKGDISYICQDFNQAFYDCLIEAEERFLKYRKIVLFFPKELMHPVCAIDCFEKYCIDREMKYDVVFREPEAEDIQKGHIYLCLKQEDLVKVVRECNRCRYRVGEEVGILMYNDMPVLEIIKKGISAISIDFAEMGRKAAEFVKSHRKVQEFLPTRLILRNSL